MKPKIVVTMGDPVGIGPEIVIKALKSARVRRVADVVCVGDAKFLALVAKRLGVKALPLARLLQESSFDINKVIFGRPKMATSRAMISYIETAVRMCMDGSAEAMVTSPITKAAAKKVGFGFAGHTEYIAHLTGETDFRMMLGGSDLKVILATIHEPIKRVPRLITKENIKKTIEITDTAFKRYFGLKSPRIAVAGLNPHAGESSAFGTEEAEVIAPVIKAMRRKGIDATGPLPPDTVFYRAVVKKEFDCVVCMYHDQGLGPLKLLHFDDGVNVTLGLKVIRTSVDHGTAYDIAGKGIASAESLITAIEMAADMAIKKRSFKRR